MTKFTPAQLVEVEAYATLIAAGVCAYEEIALGRAEYRGQRIGVDANAPDRARLLSAIRMAAVAKGYDGPPLPETDPNMALRRRAVLLELLDGEPQDDAWHDRRDFYEAQLATAPLDDPAAMEALKTRLRTIYKPAEPEAAAQPGAAEQFVQQWTRNHEVRARTYGCARGSHRYGARDEHGYRTCAGCGVVNVCPDDEPGVRYVDGLGPIEIT